MQVDPNDPNTVLWLQQSLLRVLPGRNFIEPTGQFDAITHKGVARFQDLHGLPVTGEPDVETATQIEQELVALDGQPFKKKQLSARERPVPGQSVPGRLVKWP